MKERRVENEVGREPEHGGLVCHDKEFASYSQCAGSYCVFCIRKRYDVIDHCGCSGRVDYREAGKKAEGQN